MAHEHQWREIGRVLVLSEADRDPALLSPHGLHDPEVEVGAPLIAPDKMSKKLRAHFEEKVPVPQLPYVIVQCQDEECPEGPKHTIHMELTEAEAKKLADAYERGALDPQGDGTNRLLSQASLADLGLERIEKKLSHPSGARESIV